jgi:hypothetical protein
MRLINKIESRVKIKKQQNTVVDRLQVGLVKFLTKYKRISLKRMII